MKQQLFPMLVLVVCAVAFVLMASQYQKNTFDKITVREFELIDDQGKQRVSIKIEETGEVLFRLRDQNETIRVKLGADEKGSGLLLLDSETNPGIHALVSKGASLTLTDKEGKMRTY